MFSDLKFDLKSFCMIVFIIAVVSFGYYINVLFKTDFHYIYFLDDAYIHLAMAKNFALHQVWGITSHEFSSSSSSPLFTYVLSVFIKIFGNNDQLPLYMNIVFGFGILYFLNIYYSEYLKKVKNVVLAVLFTIFFAVLHLLMLSGMEHLFQVLLMVVNILCLSKMNHNRSVVFVFYLTIVLMGLVRFESMFYFITLAFCFILIKKWKTAVMIMLTGFIPIAVFCYFNYQQDGYLFPNSVVVKGTKLNLDANLFIQLKDIILNKLFLNISFYKVGIFPIIMCSIFIFRDLKNLKFIDAVKNNFVLIAITLLMICHALFADLRGSFRYEAYILVGFSMALIPKLKLFFEDFKNYIKQDKLMSFLIVMNFILLIYKFGIAHLILNNGGKNIYEQQIQSAKFLKTYYNQSKVVANDVGAITYFTDIHLLDIVGLGSSEMIPFTKEGKKFDQNFEKFIEKFTDDNHYEIAVVYEDWFDGYIPETWKKVAVLKIANKISVYGEEVSIYCIDLEQLTQMKKNIKNFNWNKNVKVELIN